MTAMAPPYTEDAPREPDANPTVNATAEQFVNELPSIVMKESWIVVTPVDVDECESIPDDTRT
jgi:hypothetical protein